MQIIEIRIKEYLNQKDNKKGNLDPKSFVLKGRATIIKNPKNKKEIADLLVILHHYIQTISSEVSDEAASKRK